MHKNNESEDDIEEEEDPDDYSLIYAIESLRLQFHVLPSLLLSEETTSLYELTALDPCNHIRSVLSPFLRHPSNYLPQVSSKEILAFLDVFYLRKSLLEKLVAIETFAPFLINVLVVLSSVTSNSVAPKAITLIRWVLELIIAESSDFLMQYDSVMILFFEMRTQIVLNKYQNRQKRITTSMSLISIFACLLKGFAASSVNISKGARNLYNYNVRDLRIKHCLTKVLQCIKELCVDKNFSVSESALSTLETVIVPFFLCTPHTEVIWQWCLPLLNMKLAISDHIKEMKFDSILNLIFMFTFFFFEDEGQVNESNHKRRCLIDLFYQVSVLISNGRNIMLKRTLANQFVLFCKLLNLTAVVRKIYHMNCIDQNENSGDDKKETAVISSSLSKENVLLTRHRTDISGLESPASSSTFVLEDDNERDRASLKKLVDIFFLFLKPLETESNQNISGLLFLQNQAKEERVGIMPDEPNFQDNEEDNEESRMKKDEDEFVIFFCKSAAKDLFSDSFMCEVPILKDFVLEKIVKFITIPLNVTAAAELSGSLCRFGRYLRDVNSSEKHEELFLIELFMPYLFPLFQTIQHLADEIVLEMVDNLDYVGYGLGYRMFESYFLRKQKLMLSLLAHQNHRVRLQVINQWPSLFKWFVNMAKEDNFVNILLPKSCCDPVASVRLASLDFALTCLEGWEWLPSLLSHILKEGEQKYKLRVFAVRFCQSYFLRNKHQMDIFKKNFWIGGVKFKVVSEKDRVVNVRQAACSMLDSLLPNVDET